jgi:hypothetical protein
MPKPAPVNSNANLIETQLMQDLVPDPAAIPEVVVITGLLGQGRNVDVWRIYVSYDLTEYFEFNGAAVRAAETVGNRTRVWITEPPIRRVTTRSWSAEVEYLSGAIANQSAGVMSPRTALAVSDEGFGPEPTKCINTCNARTSP